MVVSDLVVRGQLIKLMAQIIQRQTYNQFLTNLELSSSNEVGRTLSIGSDWNQIKVGMRIRISGTSNFTPAQFWIGLCSGTSSMAKSVSTTNFLGYSHAAGTSYTYYTGDGSPVYVQSGGSPFKPTRRTSGTTFFPTATNGSAYISATGSVMTGLAFEIRKPSITGVANQYSMSCIVNYGLANPPSYLDTVYNYLDSTSWENGDGRSAVSFNEDSGSLDTLNIYWQESGGRTLEITDIVVKRAK